MRSTPRHLTGQALPGLIVAAIVDADQLPSQATAGQTFVDAVEQGLHIVLLVIQGDYD